jgi:hypothetical protein
MRAAAIRILRALHATLGRWLALVDPPSAVLKVNRHEPRARTRKSKRGNQHAADSRPTIERKSCSWFDLEPGTLAPPRNAEEDEIEAWARAHNLPPVRR